MVPEAGRLQDINRERERRRFEIIYSTLIDDESNAIRDEMHRLKGFCRIDPRDPLHRASHQGVSKALAVRPTERRVARAIREAVERVQASTSTRAIAAALDAGDVAGAVELVRIDLGEDFLLSVLPADLRGAYEIAGGIASKETGRMLRAGYSFNLINPRSVEWVRQNSASLIRQWGESSRDGIRRLITAHFEALRGGTVTAATLARQIKNTGIGLTWRSARAVLNMRTAMDGARRGGRRYRCAGRALLQRLLNDRAEMIARTEMTRAMTQARLESWRQATDRGLLDPLGYEKEWVVTRDARACDDCKDLDGSRASIPDGVFIGDGGTNGGTGPGYHPRCRCTVIVVPKGSRKIPRAGVNIPA